MLGCKAKRIEHTIYKTDTVKIKEVIKIDTPQLHNIAIDNPCNKFNELKPFRYTITSNKVKTVLKSVNDTLYLTSNIDSIVNSRISEYKSSITKEKEVLVKYKNKRLMWYSLICNVLLLGFIFRKPLFRLIMPLR